MRVAGIIATVLVLIAVGLGLYSLTDSFGYRPTQLFGLLWPVALGVVIMTFLLLAAGRWSVNLLNRSTEREAEEKSDQ